jgi:Arc/MetJ-type ribon-helix-helix transcriptional regulator
MASQLTLRLDEKTRQRIARLARRERLSTSEVIRQAIAAWADRRAPITSPYEALKDLIGVVRGGNPKRSAQTGRALPRFLSAAGRQAASSASAGVDMTLVEP